MIDIANVLISLRPNARWHLNGETYDDLEWVDTVQTKPTKEQVEAEFARLKAEDDAKEYQRKRAAEYPPITEQLDTLYHGGYDAWKAEIQAIKQKYPKGA